MGKIVKKPSALKSDYLKILKSVKKAVFFALLCVVVAIISSIVMRFGRFLTAGLILTALSVAGFLVCIIILISKQNDLSIKKQGVLGEDITAEVLSRKLSDDYTVFQNCVITLDGKSSELDLIVVGKSGILVIETKNRNGRIAGSFTKEKWVQHKVGAKGGEYSAEFYSPVKQVGTHIFRLAGFLRQNGIRAHIDGAVYFSNPDAQIEISGQPDNIPVFSKEKDLLSYIRQNNHPLTPENIQNIYNLLK